MFCFYPGCHANRIKIKIHGLLKKKKEEATTTTNKVSLNLSNKLTIWAYYKYYKVIHIHLETEKLTS